MLQPLPSDNVDKNKRTNEVLLPPPRTCESCGKVVPVGHDAINIMVVVGSPGHPDLAPFQCPFEEHWACSIECWASVAHACIDQHMTQLLQRMHSSFRAEGKMP